MQYPRHNDSEINSMFSVRLVPLSLCVGLQPMTFNLEHWQSNSKYGQGGDLKLPGSYITPTMTEDIDGSDFTRIIKIK